MSVNCPGRGGANYFMSDITTELLHAVKLCVEHANHDEKRMKMIRACTLRAGMLYIGLIRFWENKDSVKSVSPELYEFFCDIERRLDEQKAV
jgi:hypothetical protein